MRRIGGGAIISAFYAGPVAAVIAIWESKSKSARGVRLPRILQQRALLQPVKFRVATNQHFRVSLCSRACQRESEEKEDEGRKNSRISHTLHAGRQATKRQPDTRHTQNSLRFATFTSSFLLRALFISGVRTRIMPGRRIQFSSGAPTSFIYCRGTLKGAYAPPCVCVAAATHDPADRRRQTLYFLMQIFAALAK